MNSNCSALRLTALVLLIALACVSCAKDKGGTSGSMQTGQPSAMVQEQATVIDTVEAVDPGNRTVTLRHADGTVDTYQMGEEVRNFNKIRVGDRVKTTLTDSIALAVRGTGEPPSASEVTTIVRAPKGAMPGVVITRTLDFRGQVTAVNPQNRTVTVQGPTGQSGTFKIGPDVDMSKLKVRRDIVGKYQQILAIQVEKP